MPVMVADNARFHRKYDTGKRDNGGTPGETIWL